MKSTTRFKQNKRGIICLNCKQPLSDRDNFCSNCGQVNDLLPLSIKQFISEFFAGFFSFDTRFFKTFTPLIFKPGKVSLEYIEGKRRKYVNPFQLYLHVTIVFFLILGLFSALDQYKVSGTFSNKKKVGIVTDSLKKMKNEIMNKTHEDMKIEMSVDSIELINKNVTLNIALDKIRYHIDSVLVKANVLAQLNNKQLSNIKKDSVFDILYKSTLNFISKLEDETEHEEFGEFEYLTLLKKEGFKYFGKKLDSENIDFKLPNKVNLSVEDEFLKNVVGQQIFKNIAVFMEYDKNNDEKTILQALDDLGYPKTRWNIFYYKKAQDFNKFKNDVHFRSLYLKNIISKISIALFFMLPLFTLFLSLFYIRGKKSYTEHLVLVFNVQTVFFILLIFFLFVDRIFKTDFGIAMFVITFLVYLYKSLRNFYKQNRYKTIVKFLLLNWVYLTLSTIGFMLISFITLIL